MSRLRLTLGIGDYDHVRDLATGRVPVEGIDLTVLHHSVEEIFFRFVDRLEWEISEVSMGMYTSAVSRGHDAMIAIPVFPSRVFRHSAIYVRADGKVRRAEDLAGKTIGVPQWSQTASIYVKGWVSDTVGIPLSRIRWIQGGVNDPGRDEHAELKLPPDIDLRVVRDRSLGQMLLDGTLDAVFSARPPDVFVNGDGRVVRLFPDFRREEAAYFEQTGIFPIMHTVAIRRTEYANNRWIARNLMVAFEQARDRSVARMADFAVSHIPVPWGMALAQEAAERIFPNRSPWPYGVEANRTTLAAFLRFAFEQGTCHRHLSVEEIFAEEALASFAV